MACCQPIEIYWNTKMHKHQFKFDKNCTNTPIYVDCNKCESCQLKYIAHLGLRASHELMYHTKAMFITLTVNNENIDKVFPNNSLCHVEFQKFIRRLRDWLRRTIYKKNPEQLPKIKYLMCGEYGEKFGRPHYHAVIFGYEFDDLKQHHVKGQSIKNSYRSPKLERLWTYGFSQISKVNYEKCTYLAKYVAKAKAKDKELYGYLDMETGEIKYRKKEYMVYPKGGLGKEYFLDNHKAILRKGYFNLPMKKKQQGDGKVPAKVGIPRYYKKLAEQYFGKEYNEYLKMIEPIIEEKNAEYVYNNILSKDKDLKNVIMVAELTGMDKPSIVKALRKEYTESEVYEDRLRKGRERSKIIKSRNEVFNN